MTGPGARPGRRADGPPAPAREVGSSRRTYARSVRTVELVPDDALDTAVRAVWRRLAAAGLPGLADHVHPTNRPHLTLAAAADLPDLGPALAGLPVPVRLAGLLAFGGRRGALAWAVVPGPALLAVHAAVAAAVAAHGGSDHRHRPGSWTPHVSLGLRLTPAERGAAVALLADLPETEGALVAARSYDDATRTATPLATG